jgi:hypothetical protein
MSQPNWRSRTLAIISGLNIAVLVAWFNYLGILAVSPDGQTAKLLSWPVWLLCGKPPYGDISSVERERLVNCTYAICVCKLGFALLVADLLARGRLSKCFASRRTAALLAVLCGFFLMLADELSMLSAGQSGRLRLLGLSVLGVVGAFLLAKISIMQSRVWLRVGASIPLWLLWLGWTWQTFGHKFPMLVLAVSFLVYLVSLATGAVIVRAQGADLDSSAD